MGGDVQDDAGPQPAYEGVNRVMLRKIEGHHARKTGGVAERSDAPIFLRLRVQGAAEKATGAGDEQFGRCHRIRCSRDGVFSGNYVFLSWKASIGWLFHED